MHALADAMGLNGSSLLVHLLIPVRGACEDLLEPSQVVQVSRSITNNVREDRRPHAVLRATTTRHKLAVRSASVTALVR